MWCHWTNIKQIKCRRFSSGWNSLLVMRLNIFLTRLCMKAIIIRLLSDQKLKRKPESNAIKQSRSENDISHSRLTGLCHVWKLRAQGAWTCIDKSGPCQWRCCRGRKSKSFRTIYSLAVNLISAILLHWPGNAISIWLFWHKWHTTCCFVNLLGDMPAE